MSNILFLFWFYSMIITSLEVKYWGNDTGVDSSNKCNQTKVKSMKVFGAFKLNQYIGLLAELEIERSAPNMYRGIFRVLYQGFGEMEVEPNVTPTTISPHFSHEVFPFYDFQEFDSSFFGDYFQQPHQKSSNQSSIGDFDRMFAFSTRSLTVFPYQKTTDIVYINDTNGVTAYEIEVTSAENSVRLYKVQSYVIYYDQPPNPYVDKSKELNLYYMFLYFPRNIQINAILVVEKPKGMYINYARTHNEYLALIYTTMVHNNQKYRFRQRLVTAAIHLEQFIWNYDEKQDFCDALDVDVTAVAYLHSHYPMIINADDTAVKSDSMDVYFLEFSYSRHRVMKMHYNSSTKKLIIKPIKVDSSAHDEWIENTKLYNCRPDPYNWIFNRLPCRKDYPQYLFDEIPGLDSQLRIQSSENKYSNTDYLVIFSLKSHKKSNSLIQFLFGCIVIVIIVIIVLSFGIYFVTTGPEDDN